MSKQSLADGNTENDINQALNRAVDERGEVDIQVYSHAKSVNPNNKLYL